MPEHFANLAQGVLTPLNAKDNMGQIYPATTLAAVVGRQLARGQHPGRGSNGGS